MNKQGQTQEPVKIFIADFAMKVLREKYSLDKEEFELMLRRKHGNFWNDYYRENEEKYISSLKQYPATWLTPEMDGKEFIDGKDFEVKEYCKPGNAFEEKWFDVAVQITPQEPVGGMKQTVNKWPDEVRLKMLEKSVFYHEPNIYQYGFYDGYQLAKSAPPPAPRESEAIEKAIIEELQSILSSGVHPEYLPEKINDRIAELKGDKSYT